MLRIRKEEILGWNERRLGEAVHRVLELMLGEGKDLKESVEQAVVEIFSDLERKEKTKYLTELFDRVLKDSAWHDLEQILQGKERLVELDILGPQGQRFRVDLIALGKETILVDYKYAKFREEHIAQVRNYQEILSRFFGRVTAYLFYISETECNLVEVR